MREGCREEERERRDNGREMEVRRVGRSKQNGGGMEKRQNVVHRK